MKLIKTIEQRPVDGQEVIFYSEMYRSWIQGMYFNGLFLNGLPEDCPFWFPKPTLPPDYVGMWWG